MKPIPPHEAQFVHTTVHFTMTAPMGKRLNLERASRRLLAADIAESSAWPSEASVRVTSRLVPLLRRLRRLHRLAEAVDRLDSANLPRLLWFAIRHPLLTLKAARRGPVSSIDESKNDRHEGAQAESGTDSLTEADLVIANLLTLSAAERKVDADLFAGENRDEDRMVRLVLRGSYHEYKLPGWTEAVHVVFEPRLLLHESGVMQLTVALPIFRSLSTTDAIEVADASTPALIESQYSEPLLRDLPKRRLVGEWSQVLDATARLRVMKFTHPLNMLDAMNRYVEAVGSLIGLPIGEERVTYATVMTTSGDCCGKQELWKTTHPEDVTRLGIRFAGHSGLSVRISPGRDFGVTDDQSFYLNIGSALYLTHGGGAPEGIAQLSTVLLTEFSLLQYMRLRVLEMTAGAFPQSAAKLDQLYRDSLRVFSEMRQGEIRFGSARDIATYLVNEMGGAQIRATVQTALDLLSQAYDTKSASRASRRAFRLAFLGTVIAIIIAIPSVGGFLKSAAGLPVATSVRWLLAPIRWANAQGAWGTWIVVGFVFGLSVLVWVLPLLTRARLLHIPRALRRRGTSSGWTFEVADGEEAPPELVSAAPATTGNPSDSGAAS